jgi:hypothetical protein
MNNTCERTLGNSPLRFSRSGRKDPAERSLLARQSCIHCPPRQCAGAHGPGSPIVEKVSIDASGLRRRSVHMGTIRMTVIE